MNGRLRFAFLVAGLMLVLTACPPPDNGNGTLPVLPPPTGLSASADDGAVTLSWTASTSSAVTQYNILQGTDSNDLSLVDSVPADTLTYRATGLSNGTEYFFAVEAEDDAGKLSGPTAVVSATPEAPDVGDGTQPTLVTFTPGDGSTGVGTDVNLTFTFSKPMDHATTESAISSEPALTCDFSWSSDSTRLSCDPQPGLAANQIYTVTVSTAAEDRAGNGLAAARTFSFTVGTSTAEACVFGTSRFGSCVFGP